MQLLEGLADRQAADAVRAHSDWKYALGLDLTDAGFDDSVLSEFRAQLVAGSAEARLLDGLVAACAQQGYRNARAKQRTDSPHVLAVVRSLYRPARVAESLRATLNALATLAPDWLRTQGSPDWYERYRGASKRTASPRGSGRAVCMPPKSVRMGNNSSHRDLRCGYASAHHAGPHHHRSCL
jgi:transposase